MSFSVHIKRKETSTCSMRSFLQAAGLPSLLKQKSFRRRRLCTLQSSRTMLPTSIRRSLSSATQSPSALLARLGLSTTSPNSGVYNGHWSSPSSNGPLHASLNPSTGKVIAEVREATESDVEETIVKAREAFRVWRKVPGPKRGEVLRQIRGALSENIDGESSLISRGVWC